MGFGIGVGPLIDPLKYCYHYTKLSTAIEHILKNNTIKFGELGLVNDPKESGINGWMAGGISVPPDQVQAYVSLENSVLSALGQQVKLFCASSDRNPINNQFDRGCFMPRMWSHYGFNGKGVCLLIRPCEV